jgi:sensor c-di-GMP phosphodiesterase-like protein
VIPLSVITALAAGVVAGSAAYFFQENRYETVLAERAAEHATALADATSKALAHSQALAEKVESVQAAAEKRRRAVAADRDRAVAELVRLRDTATDTASRACSDPASPVSAPALALADVFNQCAARIVEVAAAADGHATDAMMLRDAWPK